MSAISAEHRTGYAVLCGRSNVGKSTLINRMVGEKVAIVTPRPQTTRRRILGVVSVPDAQLILVDSPGLHEAGRALNLKMAEEARRAIAEAEVIAVVIEAAPELAAQDREVLEQLRGLPRPIVVIINKIDLVARDALIPLSTRCLELVPQAEIVPVSALTGENISELIATLKMLLPVGPPLLPADQYTDQTERALAEELIREKVFLKMRQEIPFSTAVVVERFEELPERGLVRIFATIIVERESQKGMVIGAGGQQLKTIGQEARLELEQMLGRRIFLELHVKVEKNWTRDPKRVSQFGL